MYTTETFHSRPAFAKYAKMSVSLQKLMNKNIKSCNMVPTDPHSLAEKYTCELLQELACFQKMNVVTLLV